MAKKKYKELVDEMLGQVKAKNTRYSKGQHVSLVESALNNPEEGIFEQVVVKGGEVVTETTMPAQDLRDSLGSSLQDAGIDKEDAKKIASEIKFKTQFAEAVVDLNNMVTAEMLESGKSVAFPRTSKEDVAFQLKKDKVAEKTEATKKPGVDENGTPVLVPTGEEVTTASYNKTKVSNKVPEDLKTRKKL